MHAESGALSLGQRMRIGVRRAGPRSWWCAAGAGLAALAAALLFTPTSSPRAANPADAGGAPAGSSDTSFGTATPTEKFVQSFQQQVTQQLQSALAQSNETQEARLRGVEQQQNQLGDQLQALGQSLQGNGVHGGGNANPGAFADTVEAPRVNARQVAGADPNPDGATPLASLLPAGPVFGREAPPGGAERAAIGVTPDDLMTEPVVYLPGGRSRRVDANIAPHGFVEGRLLNGVVAIQGGPERESIVALHGDYQSANGFLSHLDGCMALVQGRPEIAAGRIDFKLSRLTCNFPDGSSRTWDASGWLVDADGIRGVRAVIVDNTGRKVAVAAAGGAVGGLGQRLSQQQYQISTGPGALGSSTTFIGSPESDALGGAASGAANALGQSIADYYSLYSPSLQVGGGTPVTVVLANDLRLPPSGRDLSQTHSAYP